MTKEFQDETQIFTKEQLYQLGVSFRLSQAELKVVSGLDFSSTNQQIADKLCRSEGTIKNHLYSIFKKCNAKNRRDFLEKHIIHIANQNQERTNHIKTLIAFQNYRTGKDDRTFEQIGIDPKEITESINFAIEQLRKAHA